MVLSPALDPSQKVKEWQNEEKEFRCGYLVRCRYIDTGSYICPSWVSPGDHKVTCGTGGHSSGCSGGDFVIFIRPPMVEQIQGAIDNTVGQDIAAQVQQILDTLPQFLSQSLSGYGMNADQIGQAMNSASDNTAGAVADLIAPVVTDLVKTVLMLILFLVLFIVVRLLARGIDRVFGLPVLRQLNAVLGAVFGVLKCVVFVLILCAVLRVVLPMVSTVPEIFSQETIESSVLFQYFYDHNPVYSLLQFWL